MSKRSRSGDVVWQPAKSRLQFPLLALCLAALVALIGYMNARSYDDAGLGTLPGTAVVEVPMRDAVIRGDDFSAEPRSAPMPRQAAAPRRAPSPRGAVREASVNAVH